MQLPPFWQTMGYLIAGSIVFSLVFFGSLFLISTPLIDHVTDRYVVSLVRAQKRVSSDVMREVNRYLQGLRRKPGQPEK